MLFAWEFFSSVFIKQLVKVEPDGTFLHGVLALQSHKTGYVWKPYVVK